MDSNNIKVIVRVRPLSEKELSQDDGLCIEELTHNTIKLKQSQVTGPSANLKFTFDKILDMSSTQNDVYESVGEGVVDSVFQGINGTVFAYGQTCSGKTYTCMGPDVDAKEKKGLIPRIIEGVFTKIQQSASNTQFRIKLSLVEIYQEKVRDLLNTSKSDLKIRESKARGIYIQDVTEVYISSLQQAIRLIKTGSSNRALAHNNVNQVSSRSHMMFLITLHQNNLDDLSAKSAKLTIVDLAGSEKISKTAAQGKLLDQAKYINKSLSSLGNVINALTEAKALHIPYRDSKLTRILQQSIGGNAKTNLIINLSPSIINDAETLGTLRFGSRAKNIKNKPKVNKEYTVAELLLLLQKAQLKIKQQQRLIKSFQTANPEKIKSLIQQSLIEKQKEVINEQKEQNEQMLLQPNRAQEVVHQETDEQDDPLKQCADNIDKLFDLINQCKKNPVSPPHLPEPIKESRESIQICDIENIYRKSNLIDYDLKVKDMELRLTQTEEQLTKVNRELQIMKGKYSSLKQKHQLAEKRINELQSQQSQLIAKQVILEQEISALFDKNLELTENNKVYAESIKNINTEAARITNQVKKINLFGLNLEKKTVQPTTFEAHRIQKLEAEVKLYKNLKQEKQKLEEERKMFQTNKNWYKQELDKALLKLEKVNKQCEQEREKRQMLESCINLDEKSKTKRIVALENYINQINVSYFVLKNQQTLWKTENMIYENNIQRRDQRIKELENSLNETKKKFELFWSRIRCTRRDVQEEDLYQNKVFRNPKKPREEPAIVKVLRPNTVFLERTNFR